jgi:hypothetical protein
MTVLPALGIDLNQCTARIKMVLVVIYITRRSEPPIPTGLKGIAKPDAIERAR